ncbi:hypothetical protein EXS65_03370 [Candidatus Peribacteria bacterium]|nr:hypothetical protein [Candidatus Peribacteria bacterium]
MKRLAIIFVALALSSCGNKISENSHAEKKPPAAEIIGQEITYPELGVSFSVPTGIQVVQQNWGNNPQEPTLYVMVQSFDDLDDAEKARFMMDKKGAIERAESLKAGKPVAISWAKQDTLQIVHHGESDGIMGLVLSAVEVCDVQFTWQAELYTHDSVIGMNLVYPKEKLIEAVPEYFMTNSSGCGEERVWNFDDNAPDKFIDNLQKGQLPATLLGWKDVFSKILSSVQLNKKASSEASK